MWRPIGLALREQARSYLDQLVCHRIIFLSIPQQRGNALLKLFIFGAQQRHLAFLQGNNPRAVRTLKLYCGEQFSMSLKKFRVRQQIVRDLSLVHTHFWWAKEASDGMEISPSKTVTAGPDNCTCAPIHATLSAPPRIRTVTGESARPRRMAITAAAHAPEPHASVSPAPRSWTRNLSSEREMICIKPALTRLAKRGCASSAAPSALTGAQSTSSTVCTACGFPIETMETHTFLPFSCNGQSVSAPAGRLWSPAILNGARAGSNTGWPISTATSPLPRT